MKGLLITGSNGWLGRATLKEILNSTFKDDLETIILINKFKIKKDNIDIKIQKYADKNNIKIINLFGDLGQKIIFKDIDSQLKSLKISDLKVIAIASIIHPKKYIDFKKVNIKGIENLYLVSSKYNLSKFTYISSNSPFGFNSQNKAFDESSKYSPKGGYGESKMKAEEFLLAQNQIEKITIVRAPWFHGKNMPERQKRFLKAASKGKFPLIGFGNNIRSIVDVEDLAKAAINLTFRFRKHQIYWISSEKLKMREMVSLIKRAAKDKGYIKKIPKFNLIFPSGSSSILFLIDMLLQKLKFYNMYIHVLSEIGQNIFNTNQRYKEEFGQHHTFKKLKETIHDEIVEAN